MAIYHLRATTGTRKGGQSAQAKFDYIRRQGKYADPDEDVSEVLHIKSGNLPAWAAADPAAYWRAADRFERANGRLFKELEFALPKELDDEARQSLAVEFADRVTRQEQLPYTLAIHAGRGHNPHCHLVISERRNDGIERYPETWFRRAWSKEPARGGAPKTRALKPTAWLEDTRKLWAKTANEALAAAGETADLDWRSYADQGIDQVPGVHVGPVSYAEEKRAAKAKLKRQAKKRQFAPEPVPARLTEVLGITGGVTPRGMSCVAAWVRRQAAAVENHLQEIDQRIAEATRQALAAPAPVVAQRPQNHPARREASDAEESLRENYLEQQAGQESEWEPPAPT